MRAVSLVMVVLVATASAGLGNTNTQPGVAVWREFVRLLRSGQFPAERVKPYQENLREPLLGFLELMREQADWEEWDTEPDVFLVGDRLHFLLQLTFGEHKTTYSFSFLVEGDEWFFQHMEAIALRMDQIGSPPVSEFPDLPEPTKAWMRAESEVSRDVWLYNALAVEKGRDAALDWFRDGDGYALAARSWVPFVSPEQAFVLYLCWEQADLRGNELTLERLDEQEAVVRFTPIYFMLYGKTGHLKQQISLDDYRKLFEFRWSDRAASAGWSVDFSYEGAECTLHFHRIGEAELSVQSVGRRKEPQSGIFPGDANMDIDWAIIVSSIAVLVAVIALFVQTRNARIALQTQALLSLSDRFDSEEMRTIRRRAASNLLTQKPSDDELADILDFLSSIAFLRSKGAIDRALAYNQFSWWMVRYWHAASPFIVEERLRDPRSWTMLERVVSELEKLEEHEGFPQDAYSAEKIREFLLRESRLPISSQPGGVPRPPAPLEGHS